VMDGSNSKQAKQEYIIIDIIILLLSKRQFLSWERIDNLSQCFVSLHSRQQHKLFSVLSPEDVLRFLENNCSRHQFS
jgi:hypothetical protein